MVHQFNFNGLSNDAPAPGPQLRLWISALSHVVSRLERIHSALPKAIITMPWTTMDSQFVRSYTSFICMLVSARPEYLSLVLERIVRGLTYGACGCPSIPHPANLPKTLGQIPLTLPCQNLRLPPLQEERSTIGCTACYGTYSPSSLPYHPPFKIISSDTSHTNDYHSLPKSLTFEISYA